MLLLVPSVLVITLAFALLETHRETSISATLTAHETSAPTAAPPTSDMPSLCQLAGGGVFAAGILK